MEVNIDVIVLKGCFNGRLTVHLTAEHTVRIEVPEFYFVEISGVCSCQKNSVFIKPWWNSFP